MKKNKIIICLTVLSFSCTKTDKYHSMIGELEKNSTEEKILQRKLANVEPSKCLSDVFSVEMLKAEIKALEKKQASGTKVKGKWKHINLEDLPIPQANFLNTYGSRLGDLNKPEDLDYSACNDVPCIFNTIYAKPDNISGYVHYLWYLKMGSYLTAHNTVYGGHYRTISPGVYNEKTFAVSDYLWSEEELFAFWRLSHLLKAPHTKLHNLTEIQRVPRGEEFGFMDSMVCGLAWSHGLISLQDGCLGTGTDIYPGTFYESVMHELTHQVDYHEGKKISKTYRSDQSDYLDISGIYLVREYKEGYKTIREWGVKEGAKLVTSYAGTSPAENFAETIANFRVDGSHTKERITADHWDYTSKNYFFDKSFEKSVQVKDWLTGESSLMSRLAFQVVGNCTKSSKGFVSTYFKKTDFLTPVLPSMLSCLGSKASEISQEVKAKIKVSDPDGCYVLNGYNAGAIWDPGFKTQLTALLNKYLKEIQADNAYFAKIQSFYDQIPNHTMANNAFLACSDLESEEICYQENVRNFALEKLAPLNLPESHANDLAELYLTSHSLTDTRQYLTDYYRAFVDSHKAQIDLEASDFWASCEALPLNDDVPPSGLHFKLGDGYLASSIYNCINKDFLDTAKIIVRNLAVGGIKVQHPKEELMLEEEVKPLLQKSLSSIYSKKREKENKAALDYINQDDGKLRKQILSEFSWVKDVLNSENMEKDCQSLALSKIEFSLAYDLKAPVFGVFAESACKDIHLAPEYNTWLEESKTVFAEKSVTGLEKRIVELATTKAIVCLVKFPVNTNVNRIRYKTQREACLIGDWTLIEASALKEFSEDPLVIKFKVDVSQVKSQLEVNRRRLQLRVIKENF